MEPSVSRRRRKPASGHKHLTYFKLEKALAHPGCPICHLVQTSIESYFDSFLYEKVNDVGLRARLNADNGVCNRHLYQLLGHHDGLAISLMYRPLLERVVAAVLDRSEVPGNKGACFVCESETETEERYASVMAEYLDDAEFKSSFAGSRGLCVPHYELVRRRAGSVPQWFLGFHAAIYDRLLDGVRRYIDAANWSLAEARPSLSDEEQRVWMEVVRLYAGYPGMPQRQRK